MKLPRVSLLVISMNLLLGSSLGLASVRYDLDQSAVVATVDGKAMPQRAVELLWRVAARQEKELTKAQVVTRLVENRVLGDYAHAHYSDDQLFDDQGVAFRHDIAMQDQLISTLQTAFQNELNKSSASLPRGRLDGSVTRKHPMTPAIMDKVFGPVGRPLLEYRLDKAHESIAAGVPLVSYRFPGAPEKTITMLDVYERQNVQGRIMMFSRDMKYLQQQVFQLLGSRYVLDWAERRSGLSKTELDFIKLALEDRSRRDELLAHMGLEADIHDDPVYLKDLATKVTQAEIRDYYEKHKEEFRRIEKVKARHMALATQELAEQLKGRVEKGEDFATLARQYSQSADKDSGGDLGWILHDDKQLPWLSQLTLIQAKGVVSRPVRVPAPQGKPALWEVILVEERVEGYQPVDGESVRYIASAAIAKRKAGENFRKLRQQALDTADIRINPSLLPENSIRF